MSYWRNFLFNQNSDGGGGSSAPSAPAAAPAPAPAAPAATPSAAPAPAKAATPAQPAAPKANPFVALAQAKGVQPKHNGTAVPSAAVLERNMDVDPTLLDDAPIARKPPAKPQPQPQQTAEPLDEVVDPDDQERQQQQQDDPEPPNEPQQTDDPPQPQQPAKKAYDLEQLEVDDRQFAKKMHNSAVEHFANKIKGLREQLAQKETQLTQIEQTGLPLSYFQHPEAYQLAPEYKTLSQRVNDGRFEENFWKQQLIAIESNQPFRVFRGFNAQTGEPVIDPQEYQPSPEMKVAISDALQQTRMAVHAETQRLEQLKGVFSAAYKQGQDQLKTTFGTTLAFLDDPKIDNNKVKAFGPDGKEVVTTVKQLKDNFLKTVPPAYRDHPMTEYAMKFFVSHSIMQSINAETENKLKKQNAAQASVALAEPPSSTEVVSPARSNGTAVINGRKVKDTTFQFNPNNF